MFPSTQQQLALRLAVHASWALILLAPVTTRAHLSIIRQGPESAGSLETGDMHGSALAAGDFNGDGYEDLATGAPSENVVVGMANVVAAGAVIVNYGSPLGLTHTGAALRTASSIGETSLDNARFGDALAVGDFNADNYDDLAIGAPQEDSGTTQDAGRVYILHGGPGGLGATRILALRQSDSAQGASNEAFDNFGAALTTGDFNADGRDDLAIGTPGEDNGAGAVFFFLASPMGTGITTVGSGWFKQSSLGGSDTAGDRFGAALAAGNFYGSAHADLAVGAAGRSVPGFVNAGAIYLIQGGATGLSNVNARQYTANNQDIAQQFGKFGSALAAGHFWPALVYRHLAVGEPGRTVGGFANAGRVILLVGGADGLAFGAGARILHQDLGAAAAAGERFGEALAAGDRWSSTDSDWGTDGLDELAVGSPGEVVGAGIGAGRVQVFNGRVGGPNAIANDYAQEDLGDVSESQDAAGGALVFGNFDDSGFANLAIGARAEDTSDDILYSEAGVDVEEFVNAGCVYVVAPWRQPVDPLSCRNSVVYDCEDDIVFSQRPFDRLRVASCNKVMTVLIACEKIQAGEAHENDEYTVQGWINTQIDGTQWGLKGGEIWRLIDLMHITLMYSGNDAAYSVADQLTGGANAWLGRDSDTCAGFIALMNAKADLLGMDHTQFANPAGRPWSDPYSTPADMAKLCRAAMQNTLFADIANETSWDMGFTTGGGAEEDTVVTNSFFTNLVAAYAKANGIKSGKNDPSQRCHVASATDNLSGTVIAGAYGWNIDTVAASTRYDDTANLLDLAWKRCNLPTFGGVRMAPPRPLYTIANASTEQGKYRRAGSDAEDNDDQDAQVTVVRQAGSGPVTLAMRIERTSEKSVAPMQSATYGMSPFQGHLGFTIANSGESPASLLLSTSHPQVQQPVVLQPGATLTIPPHTAAASAFTLSVQNQSTSQGTTLTVEELGYLFTIGPVSGAFGSVLWSGILARGGSAAVADGILVTVGGLDANPGSSVHVFVQRPGLPTDAIAPASPLAASLRLHQNEPNPFNPTTTIRYELAQPSAVRLGVYDPAGRLVRLLEDRVPRQRGAHQVIWDGRDASGRQVPSGVYFYQLAADGRSASKRMVLLK